MNRITVKDTDEVMCGNVRLGDLIMGEDGEYVFVSRPGSRAGYSEWLLRELYEILSTRNSEVFEYALIQGDK